MKTRPKRIRPNSLLYGKLPLIIYTVLICSLSFILGYYVGKSTKVPSSQSTLQKEALSSKQEKTEVAQANIKQKKSLNIQTAKKEQVKKEDIKPKPAVQTKPFPIQSKTTNYYTIQVGAFSSKSDAEKVKRRLQKKGYTVFINTSKRGKILYRVRVGRFLKRSDAEAAALKISINEKLKTFIVTEKGTK